jgi:hypothetical protein
MNFNEIQEYDKIFYVRRICCEFKSEPESLPIITIRTVALGPGDY